MKEVIRLRKPLLAGSGRTHRFHSACSRVTTIPAAMIPRPTKEAARKIHSTANCHPSLPSSRCGPASMCFVYCLSPVARDPHPAARSAHPLTPNPYSSHSWRRNPTARYPHVVGSGPTPVAGRPDISRAWRHRLCLNANCRWSPGHHDLPGRTGCRHFSCGRRGRHCRRFLGATD